MRYCIHYDGKTYECASLLEIPVSLVRDVMMLYKASLYPPSSGLVDGVGSYWRRKDVWHYAVAQFASLFVLEDAARVIFHKKEHHKPQYKADTVADIREADRAAVAILDNEASLDIWKPYIRIIDDDITITRGRNGEGRLSYVLP